MRLLILSGFLLTVLAILAFFWYVQDTYERGDLWLNVGTEIVGILLTMLFVDQVVRHVQEKERRRIQTVALSSLGKSLKRHRSLLCSMLKAASETLPGEGEMPLDRLLKQELATGLKRLDLTAAAPVYGSRSWLQYLPTEFRQFREQVSAAVDKYAPFLSAEVTEALQRLESSSFGSLMQTIESIAASDRESGIHRSGDYLRDDSMRVLVDEYVDAFLQVAQFHDRARRVEERGVLHVPDLFLREDISPSRGSSVVEKSYGPPIQAGAGPPPKVSY